MIFVEKASSRKMKIEKDEKEKKKNATWYFLVWHVVWGIFISIQQHVASLTPFSWKLIILENFYRDPSIM